MNERVNEWTIVKKRVNNRIRKKMDENKKKERKFEGITKIRFKDDIYEKERNQIRKKVRTKQERKIQRTY